MYVPKGFKFKRLRDTGRTVLADKNFKKGDVVMKFGHDSIKTREKASNESVQLDRNKFLDSKYYYLSDYINHSCAPRYKKRSKNYFRLQYYRV